MSLKIFPRARGEEGTTMVELVFIMPVLLLLLFGIAEFGLMFGRLQVVTSVAREGARQATLYRPTCDPVDVQSRAEDVALSYANVLGIDPAQDIQITVEGACQPGNTEVTVVLAHRLELLPRLSGVSASIPLVGRAVMRNENG